MHKDNMNRVDVTFRAAKFIKVDCLSDYERRELDCWIAEHIEQLDVRHTLMIDEEGLGVEPGSMWRLSDLAWSDWKQANPDHVSKTTGPFPVPYYSTNPVLALDVFQGTEYSEGWMFVREDSEWGGSSDGLSVRHCKSFALCLMLALQHEYNFQNQLESEHEHEHEPVGRPGPGVSEV